MEKRGKNVGTYKAYKGKKVVSQSQQASKEAEPAKIDMSQKIKIGAWHPKENTFVVTKLNSLFIYTNKRASK
tara:strand:+ start:719 stop:934 length:216 start_codon:yes stop_codon:yes gene_type:complete